MDFVDTAADLFKTISEEETIILYECCSDGDVQGFNKWWDSNTEHKKRSSALELSNHENQSLLHFACNFGQYDIVRLLIVKYEEYNIDINDLYDRYHDTPFTLACQRGYAKFEEDSVKVNMENKTERSGRFKICTLFLDHGTKIDMRDVIKRKKNSPLHWAIYHGDFATSL